MSATLTDKRLTPIVPAGTELSPQATEAAHARGENQRLREKLRRLEGEAQLFRKSADRSLQELKLLRQVEADLRSQLQAREGELAAARTQLAESENAKQILRDLGDTLRARCEFQAEQLADLPELQEKEKKLEQELKAFEEKAAQLDRREQRLRAYAETLRREKAELKELSRQLAGDLQAGKSLHPLHDYLRLTEFELSKVELQLKKTPSVSSERPGLEKALTQLIEQRDFLRAVIDASAHELQSQAAAVSRIIGNDALLASPPPPPKARC